MYVCTYVHTNVRTYVCTYAEVKQSDLIKVSMQGYFLNCCIAQQCCSHLLLARSWGWCAAADLWILWTLSRMWTNSAFFTHFSCVSLPFLASLKDIFVLVRTTNFCVTSVCDLFWRCNAISLSMFGQDLSPICLTYSLPVSRPWVQIFWPPGVPQLSWALV